MGNYKDELRHHGILGMHWGIRRFQKKDGSLTPAGKKRYGKEESEEKKADIVSAETRATISKMDELAKDTLPFGAGYGHFISRYSDPAFRKRADEAADLGLKALKKQGRDVGDSEPGDPDSRWWFLYEDQTLGLGLVADMINRGRTSTEVSNLVDFVEKNAHDIWKAEGAGEKLKAETDSLLFDVTNGNYKDSLKGFAKVCEEIKKEESNVKHSEILSSNLQHHGILGQRWGVRRYQNPDGSLTPAGRRHLEKADKKWVRKNVDKIHDKAYKASKGELHSYVKNELNPKYSGQKHGANYANELNRKMAELMNKKVSDIRSPSGKVVQFIAKRGELGVHTALATPNYDFSQFKNGIWGSGRVAYRSNTVNRYDPNQKRG